MSALDVGISCPIAPSARDGEDVVDVYRLTKIRKYEQVAKVLGWEYRPVTMTCFGRPHQKSIDVVHRLAMAAARKFGVEDVWRIEARWWQNCSTMLAERAANMVLRCSPTIRVPRELGGGRDCEDDDGGGVGEGCGRVDVGRVVQGADDEWC